MNTRRWFVECSVPVALASLACACAGVDASDDDASTASTQSAETGSTRGDASEGEGASASTSDSGDADTTDDDTGGDTSVPVEVTLQGAIQKGPLVIGSTLDVVLLDGAGNPTGEVFPTVTTSDLGEFEVSFTHAGPVALVGDGFYYDEVTGEVSAAPITLRAVHKIHVAGTQAAFVNLVTHLTERRVLELYPAVDLATAIVQAEQELVSALDIGPAGFDPGGPGIGMNLAGGDSLPNAYLFAMSAILVQAAAIEAGPEGSVDGQLQSLVNAIASDLVDGTLDPARVQRLDDAERALPTDRVYDLLAARLADLGIAQTPPNLDVVVDTDLDDIANATDTCPWVANPMQQPVLDDVCHARARDVTGGATGYVLPVALGEFDGDGHLDAVGVADGQWAFYAGDGDGGFAFQYQQPVAMQLPFLVDVDDDGISDVVVDDDGGVTAVYLRTAGFDPLPPPIESTSAIGGLTRVHGDMNGDGYPELLRMGVLSATGTADAPLPVVMLLNDGAGGFTDGPASAVIPMGTAFSGPSTSALVDVTGDGYRDFVVGGRTFAQPTDDAIAITFPGDGNGNLGAAIVSSAALPAEGDRLAGQLHLADVTGDGVVDLLVVGRSATLLCMPGHGDGTFGPGVTTPVDASLDYGTMLTVGDFTGDGLGDLLVRQEIGIPEGLGLFVIPSHGAGAFGTPVSRVSGLLGPALPVGYAAAADFDGNGADDLVLGNGGLAVMQFTP